MALSVDPLRLSVMAVIIITLSRIHSQFPAISALRPGVIATGLVAVYAFLNPRLLARGSLFRTWPAKLLVGFVVLACLAVPFGLSMGNAGKYVVDSYTKTIVFTILIIACVRNVKDLYTMGWALVISCGLLAYLSVFVFQMRSYNELARLDALYLYDANDIGCVLAASLGFMLLHGKTSRPFGRIMSLAIFFLSFVAIARTGSRGAMIGLVLAGVALLILAKGVSIPGRIFFVAIALFGLLLTAQERARLRALLAGLRARPAPAA